MQKILDIPMASSVVGDKPPVEREWFIVGRWEEFEGEGRANLLRSSGNLHLWQPNQEHPATPWEAEIDRELDLGARELDLEKRKQHYWRIQEILHRELDVDSFQIIIRGQITGIVTQRQIDGVPRRNDIGVIADGAGEGAAAGGASRNLALIVDVEG